MEPMTKLLVILLSLAAPAAAQPAADACRATGTALERSFRLTLTPADGSAPIEVLLYYAGCRTVDYDALGDPSPVLASRQYRAPGVGWEMTLQSQLMKDETDIYLYYPAPGERRPFPVSPPKTAPTSLIGAKPVDWGLMHLSNDEPKFSFRARVLTR